MQSAPDILLLGDSIPFEYAETLTNYLDRRIRSFSCLVTNRSIPGHTTADILNNIGSLRQCTCNIIVIHIGMNDWRKGVPPAEFQNSLAVIIEQLTVPGRRIIPVTITPDWNDTSFPLSRKDRSGTSTEITAYNTCIRSVAQRYHLRVADAHALWAQRLSPVWKGLKDAIHPNGCGQEIICEAIYYIVSRDHITLVWPFNGRYTACNYACPYCYVPTSVNKGGKMSHTLSEWESAFIRSFGAQQRLTFYLSFGEPTLAPSFIPLLEMIGNHTQWDVIVTSNISTRCDRLKPLRVTTEGRLNINASFHPTETNRDIFIEKLIYLRNIGIECPVVYVAYPSLLDRLEDDINLFSENGFLVHVRRFRGRFKGKTYPESYLPQEISQIAGYMDSASIRYMLTNVSSLGRKSYLGMHHALVAENGDLELCDEYPGERTLGNVFRADVRLNSLPQPFPGPLSLGAVDDIANLVEIDYEELEGNHVLSFARQGGVISENNTIIYPFKNRKFTAAQWSKLTRIPEPDRIKTVEWFLRHRFRLYFLERNLIRIRYFLLGKIRLFRMHAFKKLFHLHS